MSLQPIPHQPVDLSDHPELRDCPTCPADPEPCTLVGAADTLYLQLRNDPDPYGPSLRACDPSLPPYIVRDFCGEVWVPDPRLQDPLSWTLDNTYPATNTSSLGGGQLKLTSSAAGYNQWKAIPNPGQIYAASASESFDWKIRTGSQVAPDLRFYLDGTGTLLLDGALVPGGLQPNTTYTGTVTLTPFPGSTGSEYYFNIFDPSPTVGFESYLDLLYFDRVGNGAGTYGGNWLHTNLDGCYAYRLDPGTSDTLTLPPLQYAPQASRNWALTVELQNVSAGGVRLQLGTQTSPLYTTSGTHTWTLYLQTANLYQDLLIVTDAAFVGEVHQVQIQLLQVDIDTGGDWEVDPLTCAFRHLTDPTNTTPLHLNTLLPPGDFVVTVRVDDLTAGSVTLGWYLANQQVFPPITSAGVYSYPFQQFGSDQLALFPSADFDGLVSFEGVALRSRQHGFYLLDQGGNVVAQIPDSSIQYEGNFVSVRIDPALHLLAGDCFRVGVAAGGRCGPGVDNWLADTDLDEFSCDGTGPWSLTSLSGDNYVDPVQPCAPFPYGSAVKVVDGTGYLEQGLLSDLVVGFDYCLCVTLGPVAGNAQTTDLVTNGTFTGTLSPWASSGGGFIPGSWTYDAGSQRAMFNVPDGFARLTQTLAPLTVGQVYELSFQLTTTNGTVSVSLGGQTYAGNFTTSGLYVIQIAAGSLNNNLVFTASVSGSGYLDNVRLTETVLAAPTWNPCDVEVYIGTFLLGTLSQFYGPYYTYLPGSVCIPFNYDGSFPASAGTPVRLEWSCGTGFAFAIDYVSLQRLPATAADMTYLSNCQTHTAACDTAYLRAGVAPYLNDPANEPVYYLPQVGTVYPVAYGFQFSDYFQLAQRARVYFTQPTFDGRDDRYAYRNGYNLRHAGDLERVWELVVGGLGTSQHEALAVMSKCQYLLVDGRPYLVTQDDYSPNWAKGQLGGAADVSLEVRELKNARKFLRRIY